MTTTTELLGQRRSLYWDDFERRAHEAVAALREGQEPPVRRVAVFVTDRCNFACSYCNHHQARRTMSRDDFLSALDRYGAGALFHITGGEPSMVPWLYPLLEDLGRDFRFHLNTNAWVMPPASSVRRLKVSLDHWNGGDAWDSLVGRRGAFQRVVKHIKAAIPKTVVSITYTMTRQNYRDAPKFARFAREQFPGLYALFFSVYKGVDTAYALTESDASEFFHRVLPALEMELNEESVALLGETIDEKMRLMQTIRFPQNRAGLCYLSMSERVLAPDGEEYTCSHLYRDGVRPTSIFKQPECQYGCNRRLVMFNELVESELGRNAAVSTHQQPAVLQEIRGENPQAETKILPENSTAGAKNPVTGVVGPSWS